MSLRRAAESYGVPRGTLSDQVTGKVQFGARSTSGPSTYLTDTEEIELVQFLAHCASVGYAKSKQEVLAIVKEVATRKKLSVVVSDGWWTSFRKRHGVLTLRVAEKLSCTRAVSSSPDIINSYFDLLEETMAKNDLVDKPGQIFNLDETGMPFDPDVPKVVTLKGVKHATSISSGTKSQVTVLSCCNAAGYVLPPFVILKQRVTAELASGEVPGTVYGKSTNGWITSDLFDEWFLKYFLAYAPPARPLLLLMDGHATHYCPRVINKALESKVILFCLPPNTTHLTQPLDKGCFSPLKAYWRKKCKAFLERNPKKQVTKYKFSRLFGMAWIDSMSMANVIAGFRCTGVYTLDCTALLPSPTEAHVVSLSERYGVNFIPTYSPARSRRNQSDSCPSSSDTDSQQQPVILQYRSTVTQAISNVPEPQLKYPDVNPKERCGKILTSHDYVKEQEAKENEKREKELAKEMKKQERQRRAENKARKAQSSMGKDRNDMVIFTDDEWELFQMRLDEGYDLPPSGRYLEWLQMHHPEQVRQQEKNGIPCIFGDDEWELFSRRVEEGYDLPPVGRYLEWLNIYHPELLSHVSKDHQEEPEADADSDKARTGSIKVTIRENLNVAQEMARITQGSKVSRENPSLVQILQPVGQ